jgi:hypothetical protein
VQGPIAVNLLEPRHLLVFPCARRPKVEALLDGVLPRTQRR